MSFFSSHYFFLKAEWLKDTVFSFSQTRAEISVEFTVCDYIFSEVSKVLREMGDKMLDLFFPTHTPSKGIGMDSGFHFGDKKLVKKRELKFFDKNLPSNPEQVWTLSLFFWLFTIKGQSRITIKILS